MQYNLKLTVAFIIIISMPLMLTLFYKQGELLQTEKRLSSPLPAMPTSLDGLVAWPRQLETYIDDNFGLRPVFLQLYHYLKNAIHDSPSKAVFKGKDNWLFLPYEIETYRHATQYTDAELIKLADVIEYRKIWLKKRGIEYVIIIAPNKSTIYPEYVPAYVRQMQKKSRLDQLLDYAKQHTSVPIIDLRENLIKAKPQGWLYYKNDTHWNYFGSNIAQFQIAQALENIFPRKITPQFFSPQDFIFSKETEGDLANIIHLQPDNAETSATRKASLMAKLCEENLVTPYDDTQPYKRQCSKKALNAIIFKDSFFNYLTSYISQYFKNSLFISGQLNLDIVNIALQNQAFDIAIEEIVERNLAFFPELNDMQENERLSALFDNNKHSVFKLAPSNLLPMDNAFQTVKWEDNHVIVDAKNIDPMIIFGFNNNKEDKSYLIKIVIESPAFTKIQLFYGKSNEALTFSEEQCVTYSIFAGVSTLYFSIQNNNFNGQIRLDPGTIKGRYKIDTLEIKSITNGF